jgi:hypothetical protein
MVNLVNIGPKIGRATGCRTDHLSWCRLCQYPFATGTVSEDLALGASMIGYDRITSSEVPDRTGQYADGSESSRHPLFQVVRQLASSACAQGSATRNGCKGRGLGPWHTPTPTTAIGEDVRTVTGQSIDGLGGSG